MSYSNSIKSLLDIQDPNIIFEDDCVKEGSYKGKACKYISGRLTYDPTHCGKCGTKNIDYTIYKTALNYLEFPYQLQG